jgi:hypothetical protein
MKAIPDAPHRAAHERHIANIAFHKLDRIKDSLQIPKRAGKEIINDAHALALRDQAPYNM